MKMISLLVGFILFLNSCERARPLGENGEISGSLGLDSSQAKFYRDGKGGLFNNIKWYTYNRENHFIYPLLDIYSLKDGDDYYLIQISSYYRNDDPHSSGNYTLKVLGQGFEKQLQFDASACGNMYTNPDYYPCLGNPDVNAFTYVNLETLTAWTMRDSQALERKDWHIAFKNTDIKLNSGTRGPGHVVGSLAYRNHNLFEGSEVRLNLLQREIAEGNGQSYFSKVDREKLNLLPYYPQDGIDRIIHESFWWKDELIGGKFEKEVISKNWWILKSFKEGQFFKIHISDIWRKDGDESFLEFEFSTQRSGTGRFSKVLEKFEVGPLDHKSPFISLCLNFSAKEIVSCKDQQNDIRLMVSNHRDDEGRERSDWRIFVTQGAYGPILKEDIDKIRGQVSL